MQILGNHAEPIFDWYQATFKDEKPIVVLETMADGLKADRLEHHDFGGMGYRQHYIVWKDDNVLGRLFFDGNDPNYKATGFRAPEAAKLIREAFPNHRVSRADVAFDYCEEGAWDVLYPLCRGLAEERNIVGEFIQALRPQDGHTLRVGGKSSNVQANLYQKGFEQLKKRGELEDGDENWVRFEVRCRPQKQAKADFATLTPLEMVGSSKWSMQIAERLAISGVSRVQIDPRLKSDWQRTHGWMLSQYGGHLLDGAMSLWTKAGKPEDVHPIDVMLDQLRWELLQMAGDQSHPVSMFQHLEDVVRAFMPPKVEPRQTVSYKKSGLASSKLRGKPELIQRKPPPIQ